jgi:hypothetical protein
MFSIFLMFYMKIRRIIQRYTNYLWIQRLLRDTGN